MNLSWEQNCTLWLVATFSFCYEIWMKYWWYPDNIGLIRKTTRTYLSTLILEKNGFWSKEKIMIHECYSTLQYNLESPITGGVLSHWANQWMVKIMLDQADIISFLFISWVTEVYNGMFTDDMAIYKAKLYSIPNLCFQSSQRWHVAPSYCVAAYSLEEASSSWYRDFSFSFTQAPSVRSLRPFVRGPFLQPPSPSPLHLPSPWSRRRHLALL